MAQGGESSRLQYVRREGAEQCPDESAFRLAVAARLGYDPFVAWAMNTIVVTVAGRADGLHAQIYLADAAGRAHGSRELSSPIGDCTQLLSAAALAVSIALDPMGVEAAKAQPKHGDSDVAPQASPEVSSSVSRAESPHASPTDTAPHETSKLQAPDEHPTSFDLGVGSQLATGVAPALALGWTASVRLRLDGRSLALQGRYDLPASAMVPDGGAVTSHLWLLSLEPCQRWTRLWICGLAQLGSLRASGGAIANPMAESTLYAGAGGRIATELLPSEWLFLRMHVDLLGNLTRTILELRNAEAWRAPPLAAAVGIDAQARIW